MSYFKLLYKHVGVNILAVPYRGYTGNPGVPDEFGLMKDAKAVLEFA
eukprot:CAMPEP_0202980166 /NCGR_PEP_ID=MMETSP1396-20130829/86136_1 /ASSEMBLY_ACC=CAM_ASM_000872 /TAXON_ID= /ORGANISM="Pseudokeronopsis sp., Strain Brazil" /LENGTH=46 /DNA_ID= /DNA_START= /DNA_END= /DNA_ORIENTATION=